MAMWFADIMPELEAGKIVRCARWPEGVVIAKVAESKLLLVRADTKVQESGSFLARRTTGGSWVPWEDTCHDILEANWFVLSDADADALLNE